MHSHSGADKLVDYFALLGEPRRPWIEAEAIQAKFVALSAEVHPDRLHEAPPAERSNAQDQFALYNRAATCLRDPKERVRHLLELERGEKLSQLERLPPGASDFFFQVGQACREADRLLAEKDRSLSPLQRVAVWQKALEKVEGLQELQASLQDKRAALEQQLKVWNGVWENAPAAGVAERTAALPLKALEQVYRDLSYVGRWQEQVGERLVRLAL